VEKSPDEMAHSLIARAAKAASFDDSGSPSATPRVERKARLGDFVHGLAVLSFTRWAADPQNWDPTECVAGVATPISSH
jgi:hypothetical protein